MELVSIGSEQIAAALTGALAIVGIVFVAMWGFVAKVRSELRKIIEEWAKSDSFVQAVDRARESRTLEETVKMENTVREMIEHHDSDAAAHLEAMKSLTTILQGFKEDTMKTFAAVQTDIREINVKMSIRNGGTSPGSGQVVPR